MLFKLRIFSINIKGEGRMKKITLMAIAGLLGLSILNAQTTTESKATAPEYRRATIAVMPFIVDETIQIQVGGQTLIPRRLETEFSSEILEFLVKSRKFNVLERDYIRKILNENRITESDWAKPGEDARIGKLLVADYLVIGYIDRLSFIRRVRNIQLTGERSVNFIGTLKIHFRITEVKSGKIVFAQQLKQKLNTRDLKRTMSYTERKDMTLGDFKDILFKRVSQKAGNMILEGIYPIKVASVQVNEVMLNRGQGAGIKVGQKFGVYNMGESVIDPDTGEALGSSETKAGVIEVTSVHPKFSKAKIVERILPINPGSICRTMAEETKENAPVYPRATPGW
jgi:curli biogenesis system outer membrane secretion channel CsgG